LITSPDALEGKSTMAANLAVVMAQDGKSVVLVDADLRRPMQHKIFRLPNSTGLTRTLFDGRVGLDGRLQETGIENLRVLTAGPLPPNPSELLGSERMRNLIERLDELADVIVFDSPPVLPVTDAAVLAPRVDGVLIVAEAGQTRHGAVRQMVETLQNVGANLLGTVLNRMSVGGANGYYYYYYTSDEAGQHRPRRQRFHHRLPLIGRLARPRHNRTSR
jgi:capsular exopolysaccharide synthesis family protein